MKTAIRRIVFLTLLLNLIFISFSFGANRYWVSSVAGNWNVAGNWSASSGGAGGASVPGAADNAFFDGNGLGNCTLNANVNVTGIQLTSTYTGIVTQSTFTITLGANGLIIAGGTFSCGSNSLSSSGSLTMGPGNFNGGSGLISLTGTANLTVNSGTFTGANGNITVAGTLIINGGTFTSTSGTLTVNNSFFKTNGLFIHNSGTLAFGGNSTYQLNTNLKLVLHNLTFNGSGTNCVRNVNSDTLEVINTLTFAGASRMAVTNGVILAKGNITVSNAYTGQNSHTGTLIYINGTGNQTITGSSVSIVRGYLPTIQINKASGTLFFSNKVCVEGNWRYDAGTLDYTTNVNTLCFIFGKNFTGVSHSLGNVEFSTTTTNSSFNLGSIVLTVNGLLTLSGGTGQLQLQSSSINAKGDITITHTRTTANNSTTQILINGTIDQTINGTGAAYQGRLPAVTINKATGTLFLVSNVTIEGNYTYIAGTIDYTTNSNTVCFYGVGSTLTLSGSHSLGSVDFVGNGGAANIYSLGAMTLNVFGTLTFSGTSQFRLSGGTINSKGNIIISNSYNANNSHTSSLLINGTSDQSITSSVGSGNGRLPNITINKAAGNVLLSGTISLEGNWTFTTGGVLPQTSIMYFFNTAKTIDCEGTSTMNFYSVKLGDASTRTLMGDLSIQNVLDLQTGRLLLNGNSLLLENSSAGALTFSTGGIISENTSNLSKVVWMIGTTTGAHVIPFENMSVFDIPFTFNLTSGDAGTVTVSTYPTAANNTPFPVLPQTVTNVFTNGNIDNSANTVNRFWQIDKTGVNPIADITFTYGDNEWDVSEPANYVAQRYDDVTDIWQSPTTPQTPNTTLNQVIVQNVSTFSPWTLATADSPLAIEMMTYNVYLSNDKVNLEWAMANENNIEKYRIDKTTDMINITSFHYENTGKLIYSVTDENTENGIWYYRIAAIKFDGSEEYLEWKMIVKTSEIKLSVCPNPVKSGERICISGLDADMTLYPVTILDLQGKLVFSNQIISNNESLHLNIPSNISQGCYFVNVSNKNFRLVIE